VNEIDLLEKYEPVLRFAKSERFFPMAVEPYLERCVLFSSGPQSVLESVAYLGETLLQRIGKLESEQYYLRYVNNPLRDSDAWVWWGATSLLGSIGIWFLGGWPFVVIAAALSLIAALVIFMVASPIRLRIIPAALAAFIFIVLEGVPILFFLSPRESVGIAVEYLILLPIYLLVLFYLFVRTMKFILDRVIPEFPGLIMDMLSQSSERIAQESYSEYAKILEKDNEPVYYGRVVHEADADGNNWTILQYHFFYAFNDWRLAANGMNHHEGDWEMVAVYLKNDKPYAVLFSQHGAGNMEKWETTLKVIDKDGRETTHPIVYVALGSHANYSRPEVIRSPSMYKPGRVQRMLFRIDGWIHYIFMLVNPNQKARQLALKEMQSRGTNVLAEDAFMYMRDEEDHYVVSLPMEIASGDGFRIGYPGDSSREGVVRSSSYIRRIMSGRKTSRPAHKEWRRVLLNPEPDWVQYKGLWGVKSWLQDESGPPGPKWDRPARKQVGVKERKRWGRPLEWLEELEHLAHPGGKLH
jgi:hypothetical protein